jgi:hypothetical protein
MWGPGTTYKQTKTPDINVFIVLYVLMLSLLSSTVYISIPF